MSRSVLLTAMDFLINGITASFMRAFTVDGYVRCVGRGHEEASS